MLEEGRWIYHYERATICVGTISKDWQKHDRCFTSILLQSLSLFAGAFLSSQIDPKKPNRVSVGFSYWTLKPRNEVSFGFSRNKKKTNMRVKMKLGLHDLTFISKRE